MFTILAIVASLIGYCYLPAMLASFIALIMTPMHAAGALFATLVTIFNSVSTHISVFTLFRYALQLISWIFEVEIEN